MPKVRKQTASRKRSVKAKSVLDRVEPIGFDGDDGIHINLYGKSGTGKTTTWATFPKPILAILCSGSARPGELRSIDTPSYRKTIQQVSLEKSSELEELVDDQAVHARYSTVVLDHASGLQDAILREVLGLEEVPEQLSWGLASREQYGQVALQMKTYLRKLLDLSCNVVIIAQEREFNTDGEGDLLMPYVASALTPSVVGWLNPACDYICQTFIREQVVNKVVKIGKKQVTRKVPTGKMEYCLRTAPDAVYTTKFRVPKGTPLPPVVVDPDYDKLLNIIKGGG